MLRSTALTVSAAALLLACSEPAETAETAADVSDVAAPAPDSDAPPADTPGSGADLGPTCSDECAPIGEARCADGGVETCGLHDDDGCSEWSAPVPCPEGQTCTAGTCGTACSDGCPAVGATRCTGSGLQTCGDLDANGCREWSEAVPCPDGTTCAAGVCATGCSDECGPVGTTRCTAFGVETCGQWDADTCREWSDVVACPGGQTCSAGVCSGTCVDECSTSGATLCSGNGVITCGQLDGDSCLDWSTPVACPEGETCSGGGCSSACADECDTVGALRCAAAGPQACGQVDADDCLEWGAATACPAGETCSLGQCAKTCTDECSTPGARRCTANGVERCDQVDADACLDWSTPLACPPGESCSFGQCDAACKDECPGVAATACDGPFVRTCGNVDSDPCLEWSNGVPCDSPLVCAAGECGEACVDECPAEDTATCELGAARRCGHYDTDPCLEWGTPEVCAPGTSCAFGACVPGCVDECAAGTSACEAGAVRACAQADADPCLEWGTAAPCAVGCSAGACAVECTDDCVVDASECAGPHAVRQCGQYDADACLDWSPAALCGLGGTCSAGQCAVPATGPTCDEALACRLGCEGNAGCELSCAFGIAGQAATALSALDACAANHACTDPLCAVLFCTEESAACRFPEPGTDACIDALECVYDCTQDPLTCLSTCAATATPEGQAQLWQLVGCTGYYCDGDADCADQVTNSGGPCSVEFATCLGPDDPGADCRSLMDCVGACTDDGGDVDTCESTCLPAGHIVGQSEYFALMGCSETFACDGPGCLAQFCAYEFATCLSAAEGTGSCAELATCADGCTTTTCDTACLEAADLQQQVIYGARRLCVRDACPSPTATCATAALQGPCAGVEATCQGL